MQIMAVQRRLPELRREVKTLRRELGNLLQRAADSSESAAANEFGGSGPVGNEKPGRPDDSAKVLGGESRSDSDAVESVQDSREHPRCLPFRRPAA
jgi:hypothetical protein